jgi:2-desacetyl-2-hydroxyethyl bacteriochlorophyllide A dehydrogenase
MTGKARAFWITGAKTGEIRAEELGSPQAGQVLVEARYSGISRGTEALVFEGRVPVSEYQRMRCPFQAGEFPAPVKYGYTSVGRVSEGPSVLEGRLVFCLYPHQSAYVVPESAVFPLPGGVPPERAVLAANMETAVNALWDGLPRPGDRISVVGAGVVGSLCAYLARRLAGTDVELVDVLESRSDVAATLGAHFASPADAAHERDLVIHASGTPEGLRTALELAAAEATVLELSWYGEREVALELGRAFHVRRLTLRSSQVGQVSPNARPRWTRASRLAFALELCRDPALDVLIDAESEFEALPETLARLSAPGSGGLCHRVRYP